MNIAEVGIWFLIYWIVGLVVAIISNQDEDYMTFWSTGIVGVVAWLICSIFEKLHNAFLNSMYKSIIIDKKTNKKHFVPFSKWFGFYCNDIQYNCPIHYRKVKNSDVKKMQKKSEVFPATDEMLEQMSKWKWKM